MDTDLFGPGFLARIGEIDRAGMRADDKLMAHLTVIVDEYVAEAIRDGRLYELGLTAIADAPTL